jgi:hypothetical protein
VVSLTVYDFKTHRTQCEGASPEPSVAAEASAPDIEEIPKAAKTAIVKQTINREDFSNLIPIADFGLLKLADYALENEMEIEIDMDIKIKMRPAAKKASEVFRQTDYINPLKLLSAPDEKVSEFAAAALSKFHGDPKRPEMHTIRMTDFA